MLTDNELFSNLTPEEARHWLRIIRDLKRDNARVRITGTLLVIYIVLCLWTCFA